MHLTQRTPSQVARENVYHSDTESEHSWLRLSLYLKRRFVPTENPIIIYEVSASTAVLSGFFRRITISS